MRSAGAVRISGTLSRFTLRFRRGRGPATGDQAVREGQYEQSDRHGSDEAGDDDDGEGPLGLAADSGRQRRRQQAENGERRRHENHAEATGGTGDESRQQVLSSTPVLLDSTDDE